MEWDAEQRARASARAERFRTMPDLAPIERPKRIAWPGGKITTNRDDALEKFLERRPSKEEQARQLQQLQQLRTTVLAVNTAATTPPSDAPAAPSAAPAGVVWRTGGFGGGGVTRRAMEDPDARPIAPGSTVALTGNFADREALRALLAARGVAVSAIVHKRVDFVVATDKAVRFPTQHVRKALARGVAVVSETWLRLGLLLQQMEERQPSRGAGAAGGRPPRSGRAAPSIHWRMARHNPYRMLRLLKGWGKR
jgi:NAD-dependent DNA ligase